jgi:hypothetical protein
VGSCLVNGPARRPANPRDQVVISEAEGPPGGSAALRQLWDAKGSALVESMEPTAMTEYAKLRGWTLAGAHARSGDAIAIGSHLGSGEVFDKAIARFAETAPTRTNAITRRSKRRSTQALSRPKRDCRPI